MSWSIIFVFSPLIMLGVLHLYVKYTEYYMQKQSEERQDDE